MYVLHVCNIPLKVLHDIIIFGHISHLNSILYASHNLGIVLLLVHGTCRAIWADKNNDRPYVFIQAVFPHIAIPVCGYIGAKRKEHDKIGCFYLWSGVCAFTR